MKLSKGLLLASLATTVSLVRGFIVHSGLGWKRQTNTNSRPFLRFAADTSSSSSSPLDELSEERKDNLFQFLLRDLQVEGVPLLEVDADQVHTLQAALWTTMAELSEQTDAQKVCLIFQDIPITALRSFVDDLMILKTQERLIKFLPELERFSLSLVGKGVGPAILIEATEKKPSEANFPVPATIDENRSSAAMKMFVDRMVAGRQISGYVSTDASTPMMYRSCNFADVTLILSSFWNNICELLMSPPQELKSTMLMLPAITDMDRFRAVSELLSRSLCLYRGDNVFELLHLCPVYDRNLIHPADRPAHGHLPPISWLRPMLRHNGNTEYADTLTDKDLALINYLRRAPTTSVCIVPVDLLEANLSPEDGIVSLDLGGGEMVQASGVATYAKSVIDLSSQGEDDLESLFATEREIAAR